VPDIRTSEVDAKLAALKVGVSRIKFGNHENQTILP
jgi:hypothetical protein